MLSVLQEKLLPMARHSFSLKFADCKATQGLMKKERNE
jgi:hypothetical protein